MADFCFQHRSIADRKGKDIKILALHCLLYSLPFIVFGWLFALLAGILHFPVDYITSKFTSKYYKEENYYMFFNVIGADQAVHMTILITTLILTGA